MKISEVFIVQATAYIMYKLPVLSCYTFSTVEKRDKTRSSAVAEKLRDASCH